MCDSVVRHRVTAVVSGNSVGKDYWVGGVVPWWLWTRPYSLVIVSGPSQTILGSITWKEIRRAINGARCPMGARISDGVKTSPQVVDLGNGWSALGYSTTNVERASGQHAGQLLVIAEEASGVEDESWEAIDALKYTKLIAIGNPLRAEGGFVKILQQADTDRNLGIPERKRVHRITIPSTDSPHAHMETSPWGLADKTWLEEVERKYGKDSLWYRSHVLAIVPEVSSAVLIPEAWLDYAALPEHSGVPNRGLRGGHRRISADLGEGVGRDRTVVLVRDDLGVLEVVTGSTAGLEEAAATVWRLMSKWQVEQRFITYDKLGIGKKLPNHLARHGITAAVPYAGSGSARNAREFTNLRSEAGWKLHLRLDPNWCPDPRAPRVRQPPFSIPAQAWWPMMREDLKTLTYDLVGKQTRLLPKEDWCEILGRSPDHGDALLQSFAFT